MTDIADLDLSVTTYIDAPPEMVWQVMTQRQEEWWCPTPWRAEIVEQDWRPGGRAAMIMRGPNGEEMPNEGVFLDVGRLASGRAVHGRHMGDRGGGRGHALYRVRPALECRGTRPARRHGFRSRLGRCRTTTQGLVRSGLSRPVAIRRTSPP